MNDDDDLYSGYNQSPGGGAQAEELFSTSAAEYGGTDFAGGASNAGLSTAGGAAVGPRPMYSAAGFGNPTQTAAPGTAFAQSDGSGRPMTSMNAAGFMAAKPGARRNGNFDPLKMGSNSVRCVQANITETVLTRTKDDCPPFYRIFIRETDAEASLPSAPWMEESANNVCGKASASNS